MVLVNINIIIHDPSADNTHRKVTILTTKSEMAELHLIRCGTWVQQRRICIKQMTISRATGSYLSDLVYTVINSNTEHHL